MHAPALQPQRSRPRGVGRVLPSIARRHLIGYLIGYLVGVIVMVVAVAVAVVAGFVVSVITWGWRFAVTGTFWTLAAILLIANLQSSAETEGPTGRAVYWESRSSSSATTAAASTSVRIVTSRRPVQGLSGRSRRVAANVLPRDTLLPVSTRMGWWTAL